MLFKNAMIYRLTKTFHLSSDDFREMLEARRFVPCAGYKPSSFGWVSPLGNTRDDESPLLHEVSACYLLCARREEKVIPTSALNEAMLEKVAKIEASEDRTLRAKEKRNIKENTLAELLPGALAKSKQVLGYISPADDLLVIGTASAAEAELFINCIRDSIGSFSVVPPQVKQKPQDIFTNWLLRRKLPENFQLGNQCDLLDIEETSTVSCRRQDLDTQEIRSHLEAGKICTRIGILWHGDLSMSVDKDIVLRQVKFESSTDEDDFQDQDPIAKLDAEFVTMTLEFGRFLPELMSALGGETLPGE